MPNIQGHGNQHGRKTKKVEASSQEKSVGIMAALELRSQVFTSSTFVSPWRIMTWSLTIAGLPRAGAN